jgi:hypothetical protein
MSLAEKCMDWGLWEMIEIGQIRIMGGNRRLGNSLGRLNGSTWHIGQSLQLWSNQWRFIVVVMLEKLERKLNSVLNHILWLDEVSGRTNGVFFYPNLSKLCLSLAEWCMAELRI